MESVGFVILAAMIIRSTTFIIGVLAASLGLPQRSHAQNSELARDHSNNFNNGYSLAPAGADALQGSPYLLPQWAPATLRLAPDRPPVAVPLKYDVYRQELRIKRPQGDSVIVPLAQVREFSLSTASPARRFVCYPAATLPAEVGGACAEALAGCKARVK